MTAVELIDKTKRCIRNDFKGYDSNAKLRGSLTFVALLNSIDSQCIDRENSSQLISKLNTLIQLAKNKTKGNSRAYSIFNDVNTHIYMKTCIMEYISLNNTTFTITEKEVDTFKSLGIKDDTIIKCIESNLEISTIKNNIFINIVYKDRLYTCSVSYNDKESAYEMDVSTGYFNEDNEHTVCYTLTATFNKSGDNINWEIRDIMCNNKNCMAYKISGNAFFNGSAYRDVACSESDCEKCTEFGSTAKPCMMHDIVYAIFYATMLRRSNTHVEIEDAPKYEPIPLPESDKDVVIYLDKYYDEIRKTRVKVYDDGYIPSTHASPREHIRRSCIVHRKNGKTFERKGCIVNKGHTKTSYTIKTTKRSKENLAKKPEDYVREILGLKEDI